MYWVGLGNQVFVTGFLGVLSNNAGILVTLRLGVTPQRLLNVAAGEDFSVLHSRIHLLWQSELRG